jgi:hypothetical protein
LSDQPPYSPDLAPNDYHLFTYLKNWLGSQRFNNIGDLIGVETWLISQTADFFDTGIEKLNLRQGKYLYSGGDYVEK